MGGQLSGGYESESVIPFAPVAKNAAPPDSADQLDEAGQTILRLLHKAAGVAEANSQHALDMAQKLSPSASSGRGPDRGIRSRGWDLSGQGRARGTVATQGLHRD